MSKDKLTACKECGFPIEWERDLVILDCNALSITSMLEDRCETCGHFKDGSTILKIKPILQKYQKAGKKCQRREILKIIRTMLNPIYNCKCGWKGSANDLGYDSDAVEWSCPDCGNEIYVDTHPERYIVLQKIKSKIEEME